MIRLLAILAVVPVQTHYQAYLVRFQRGQEHDHWRVTLHAIHSAKTINFATEQEFIRYLQNALRATSSQNEPFDAE